MMTPQDSPYWANPGTTEDPESQRLIEELLAKGTISKRPVQGYPYPRTAMPMRQEQNPYAGQASQYAGYGRQAYGAYNSLFGSGSSGGGESASSSASSLPIGYILAAIQAQHKMSSGTDRRVDQNGNLNSSTGHRTGDVFSNDFFTEPWMAFAYQKLGMKNPTPGEKTDAAVDRIREGHGGFNDFMGTVPETAYQWFDPGTTFVDDLLKDKLGDKYKAVAPILMPHTGVKRVAELIGGLF